MSYRFAVSTYYWLDNWTQDQIDVFARTAAAGFDGIELSLYAQPDLDIDRTRAAAADAGLEILVSTGVPAEANPSSAQQVVRDAAVDYLTKALTKTAALGSPVLGGLTYAPWMDFSSAADPAQARDHLVSSLSVVAGVAADLGITLCLEPVNRFETCVLNTAAEASAVVDAVASPAVAVQLDTFHMNIEERNPSAAIAATGTRLGHFQVADNDRGVPGVGTIDFANLGAALATAGYDGWIGLETFPHPGTDVGRDTFTWRDLVADHDRDAAEALSTLRQAFTPSSGAGR